MNNDDERDYAEEAFNATLLRDDEEPARPDLAARALRIARALGDKPGATVAGMLAAWRRQQDHEVLTMPPAPWIELPDGEQYAWHVFLGRAIGLAADGVTTELRDPRDGAVVAVIGPPPLAIPVDTREAESRLSALRAALRARTVP